MWVVDTIIQQLLKKKELLGFEFLGASLLNNFVVFFNYINEQLRWFKKGNIMGV